MTNVTTSTLTQDQADSRYQQYRVIQTASPTNGSTVVMNDDSSDGTLLLTPSGTLAALTIKFPSDANSRLGQVRRITSSQSITTLTLTGATIANPISSMLVNDNVAYEKVGANKWGLQQ